MASYAESLLSDGEVVMMRQRQHPLSLFFDARSAIGLWIVAVALLVAIVWFRIGDAAGQIVGWLAFAGLVIGIVIFAWNWWHWRTEEYLVTNRRLMKVSGIINKESADSSLEKINDAILQQNAFGRLFDYGDLEILTAAEIAVDRYHMLNHAKAFKIEMLNAKHTLEHEMTFVPSPPLRSDAAAAPAAPYSTMGQPPGGQPAPMAQPPAGQAPMAAAYPPAAYPPATGPDAQTAAYPPNPQGAAAPYPPAAPPYPQAAPPYPPATPPSPVGAESGVPGGPPDTAEEVTAALSRLADLRDRGAITPQDYDAKKAELLSRL
jgi:PH (Pleckstrin Homology) domain-containing protein/putative oligomerization/nucleic acid binding protein